MILSSKSSVLTADEMRRDVEASLEALRTDFIDIYKIHNLRLREDYDKAIDTLAEARKAAEGADWVKNIDHAMTLAKQLSQFGNMNFGADDDDD